MAQLRSARQRASNSVPRGFYDCRNIFPRSRFVVGVVVGPNGRPIFQVAHFQIECDSRRHLRSSEFFEIIKMPAEGEVSLHIAAPVMDSAVAARRSQVSQ